MNEHFLNFSLYLALLIHKTHFMSNPIILNAFYDAGNKAGVVLAWGTSLLLTVELVYVMFKYVFAKNKE